MQYWSTVFLLFCIDFASKTLAKSFLESKDIMLWDPFLSFHLAFNKGIAFSFPIPYWAQIIFTLAFLSIFLYWWHRYFSDLHTLEKWGSVIVFAGALGNFWERVIHQEVTDFILVMYPPYAFPVFNIADICIVGGMILWAWGGIKK